MGGSERGDDKLGRVLGIFDSIAPGYDRANRLMSLGRDRRWRRLVARRCELRDGDSALDICCGTGELTLALASAARDLRVTGLDYSSEMLAVAKAKAFEKAKASGKANIDFIEADATRLPFPDGVFDAAAVGWGLRNVPDLDATLAELYRVVRPGGKIVSIDMGHPGFPPLAAAYWFVSGLFVPAVGRLVAANDGAYRYLHDSAREFIDQRELAARFRALGMGEVRVKNFLAGAVALVEGKKPLR